MKLERTVGSTSEILNIAIQDSSATDGSGLTGLLFNTAGLVAKYKRAGDSSWTTITLVTAVAGTWTSSGFIESDSGAGGDYELHVPNAALASGVKAVWIVLYGAANMLPKRIEIQLNVLDNQTADSWPTTDESGRVQVQSGTSPGQILLSSGVTTAALTAGTINAAAISSAAFTAEKFGTDFITATSLAADVTTELQAGLATSTALSTVDNVVDAIKVVTDQFVFTVANQVDANSLTSVATASAGSFEAYQGARNVESTIYSKLKDTSVIAVTVLDSNGDAVDLTGKTLKLVVEDADGTDIATQDTVTETSTGFSFAPTAAMVASVVDDWSWSAYDTVDGDADCGSGPWIVQYRAYAD